MRPSRRVSVRWSSSPGWRMRNTRIIRSALAWRSASSFASSMTTSTTRSRQLLSPYLGRIVGTRGTSGQETERSWIALDWYCRVSLPAWLRSAGLIAEADAVEATAPIVGRASALAAQDSLERARARAEAARAAVDVAAGEFGGGGNRRRRSDQGFWRGRRQGSRRRCRRDRGRRREPGRHGGCPDRHRGCSLGRRYARRDLPADGRRPSGLGSPAAPPDDPGHPRLPTRASAPGRRPGRSRQLSREIPARRLAGSATTPRAASAHPLCRSPWRAPGRSMLDPCSAMINR